jgi:hypothetical protein
MANQYYELIQTPTYEIDGKLRLVETWNMDLGRFLKQNDGKRIFIYEPTITTNKIRAIVI